MAAYYNEFDPFAAAWLRELIKDGLIADGEVDERSIKDVAGGDLRDFTQCHFFAGIGGWSYALRLAGWPDDRPVWTGSCPCQPFSAAGKRQGEADARHLWPDLRRLVSECSPAIVFGEQVASADGRLWLDGVRSDLEALAYEVGAADLCAAGVGAPHIRQRLYWVANTQRDTGEPRRFADQPDEGVGAASAGSRAEPGRCSLPDGGVADAASARCFGSVGDTEGKARDEARLLLPGAGSQDGRLAHADGGITGDGHLQSGGQHGQQPEDSGPGDGLGNATIDGRRQERSLAGGGIEGSGAQGRQQRPWHNSLSIACADGKSRVIPADETGQPEPALFPLAYGIPNRVGTLRGAGNAIVPQVAAEFIQAADEAMTLSLQPQT